MTGGRDDADWLAAAVELAVRNVHEGGGPFGAVIVRDGQQIGAGQNRVTRDNLAGWGVVMPGKPRSGRVVP